MGELEKRIMEQIQYQFSMHIGDFHGDKQPYIMKRHLDKIIEEATRDIYEPINKLESINNPIDVDYVVTYQKIIERLKKWLGDRDE